ncbi:peptide deformylase [Pseudooceanicola aestuarii]|uniref:peptide deformylase n=1 Tax=Pseudooceanicola aestuarii TaxID=2697319 RepID=UPI0013D2E493|nr:peptide deformylase [Pseudooceanicola aestuarii]
MPARPLVIWPDARLARPCSEVPHGLDCRALIVDMFDTMYAAPGRGLAAPQIGVMQRIFVMDCGWKTGSRTPRACLNPEITDRSDSIALAEEACLSIPGISAEVPRPAEITLRWYDPDWTRQEARLSGFDAICAQHEFDHLEGRLYLDYLPPDRRATLDAAYGIRP